MDLALFPSLSVPSLILEPRLGSKLLHSPPCPPTGAGTGAGIGLTGAGVGLTGAGVGLTGAGVGAGSAGGTYFG